MKLTKLIVYVNIILLMTMTLALANSLSVSSLVDEIEFVQVGGRLLAQANSIGFDTTPIPFEITSDFDITNVQTVIGLRTRNEVSTPTGVFDAWLRNDGSIANDEISLFNRQDQLIAKDVLRPNLRQNIVFSCENTIRSAVMVAHPLLSVYRSAAIRNDENDVAWIQIYNAVDDHPQFEHAVALVCDLGYIPIYQTDPRHDEYYDRLIVMALDLIEEFLEDGAPKSQSP